MSRREIAALIGTVALAFGLRLGIARTPLCISTDGVEYVRIAAQIQQGKGGFDPVFSPGYPLLILGFHQVSGLPLEQSARYLSALCGALVVLPAWWVWRSALGPAAAALSCLVLAVWPLSVKFGSGVYTEPPSLLGIFAGLCAWLLARREGGRTAGGAAGLCWGAVAWMKPEVLAWSGWGALDLLRLRRWQGASALILVSSVVYLPYVLLVHEHTGRWQIAAKQEVNLRKAQAVGRADYVQAYERLREGRGAEGRESLFRKLRRAAYNLYLIHRYAVPRSWPPFVLVLIGIGGFLAWRERRIGAWLGLPLAAGLPLLFFLVDARILHPFFAVPIGLAGAGMARIRGWKRWGMVGLCLFLLVPQALRPLYRPDEDQAERRAGLWLAGYARGDEVVLDRKPFVAYYAGLPQVWPPARPGLEGLRLALRQYEKVVLVVDDRYFRASRPDWFAHLACPPLWLRELARFTGPEGREVRLLLYEGDASPGEGRG